MKKRLFLIVGAMLFLLIAVEWSLYANDTIPAKNASALSMLNALSPVRAAMNDCWHKEKKIAACDKAMSIMDALAATDSEKAYFSTLEGTLIGSDYKHRVTVILVSHIENGELQWQCSGGPRMALPQACR